MSSGLWAVVSTPERTPTVGAVGMFPRPMDVRRTNVFMASLRALKETDEELFVVVASDIQYLLEMKRSAVLPQVGWGVAQSAYRELTGEVRSHIPGREAFVRLLFAMPHDESVCVLAVMGDKNSDGGAQGNEWYDVAVPMLDQAWANYVASQAAAD